MLKQQSGFTLIELIMVIVVLAALAVTAIPRYVDLQTEAQAGANQGVAGALASGSAINYAACAAGATPCTNGAAMDACNEVAATLTGGLPGTYTLATTALNATVGGTAPCVLTHTASGTTATFTAITPP
ncbi:MAG: type II secretion system protein [Gammaproteobacteria bacterium]|jgi:prepilin-type N-terminal cleavage/methylation domain-containing protein|nr:type II secretion system protein [Gammaproteobacteria bacterium]